MTVELRIECFLPLPPLHDLVGVQVLVHVRAHLLVFKRYRLHSLEVLYVVVNASDRLLSSVYLFLRLDLLEPFLKLVDLVVIAWLFLVVARTEHGLGVDFIAHEGPRSYQSRVNL